MNLNQLRTLNNVVNNKGFSLTAKELFLTQPSINTQVKQLEDAYEFKLLERLTFRCPAKNETNY